MKYQKKPNKAPKFTPFAVLIPRDGVSCMKVIAKTIATILFGVIVFEINVLIGYFWLDNIVGPFSYPAFFEFIQPGLLFAALPEIFLYFAIGWFVFEINSKYIWHFIVISVTLKIYLITPLFTEHSTLLTKLWAYASDMFPGLTTLLGNILKKQLTRRKSMPAAGRS